MIIQSDTPDKIPDKKNTPFLDAWVAKWAGTDQLEQVAGLFPEDKYSPLPPPDKPHLMSPAQVRRRKRGQRLAQLVASFADWLAPALMEMLREAIVQQIRETLANDLPGAVDVLLRKRTRRAG